MLGVQMTLIGLNQSSGNRIFWWIMILFSEWNEIYETRFYL